MKNTQLDLIPADGWPTSIEDALANFNAAEDVPDATDRLAELGIDVAALAARGCTVRVLAVTGGADSLLGGEPAEVVAMTVFESGNVIDILLIDPETSDWSRVCQAARWLGGDNIGDSVVRLHRQPLDWLAAGGAGIVNLHPYQRDHFPALKAAGRIECDEIELAIDCWDWSGADDADLTRFEIDDDPENVEAYFRRSAGFNEVAA